MPKPLGKFDAESVLASWNRVADAYAQGQASGIDSQPSWRCVARLADGRSSTLVAAMGILPVHWPDVGPVLRESISRRA